MALSNPRSFFGVHSFTPYSRTDGTFYGTVKVLKSSSLSMSAELIEQTGGSSKYPWNVEDGAISAEMSLKFGQFEDFLFELFLGKAPTAVTTEASGNASALTNFKGTSAMSATTGIASVGVKSGSESDLKFGKYVVKAVSATTVDVYFSSDADIARGTNGTYQNDALKITASALTITASSPVTIPSFGLELTGGSGTIALVTGDTATFAVRPVNNGGMTVRIGSAGDTTFPEFGTICMAQKRGNQELLELDIFRCKSAGLPLNFDQNAFAEAEVKVKVLYDSAKDGIFDVRFVKPSNS
jgi:hypothetical protein